MVSHFWFTVPKRGKWKTKYNRIFRESIRIWEVGPNVNISTGDYFYIGDPRKLIDIFKVISCFPYHIILSKESQTILWHNYYGPIPIPKWEARNTPVEIDFYKRMIISK